VLAVGVRLIRLDHTPYVDELNHVLAARSLLTHGGLELVAGGEPYTRAWLFTYLVAGVFALAGESLVGGRLPAVLAGGGLVLVIFFWTRAVAGRAAAWIAALLLCFAPISIYLSQQVRFYSVHALLFWLGVFAVYAVLNGRHLSGGRQFALVAVAALAFLAALHLQIATLVGLCGVGVWVTCALALDLGRRDPRRRRVAAILMVSALGAAVLWLAVDAEPTALLQRADLWAEGSRDNSRFYHDLLLNQYATLWSLFPLACLLALAVRPRAVALLLCIFGVAFVVHSLAAWKHERYLFYALPAFFIIAGVAAAEVLRHLRQRIGGLLYQLLPGARAVWRSAAAGALLLGGIAFAALGNGAASYTLHMLVRSDEAWIREIRYRGEPNWDAVAPALQSIADSSAVLVSSIELKGLYYLGRLDLLLSADYLPPSGEFGRFRKHARNVISTPESLAEVMACRPSGLLVIERNQWNRPWGVRPPVAELISQATEPILLPERARVLAFRWNTPVIGDHSPPECSRVERSLPLILPE
jgi:hypothetical protein